MICIRDPPTTAVEDGATLSATAGPVQAYDTQCRDGVLYGNHAEMQHCVAPSGALTGSRPLKVRLHPLRCTGVWPMQPAPRPELLRDAEERAALAAWNGGYAVLRDEAAHPLRCNLVGGLAVATLRPPQFEASHKVPARACLKGYAGVSIKPM